MNFQTPPLPQMTSVIEHDVKDMIEVASELHFLQDEIVSTSDSSCVQESSSEENSSDHHLKNLFTSKLCDKPELLLNDDTPSLCLSDNLKKKIKLR